ncbi:hypothetical protein F5X97DRAFT_311941 [Nemania serpens]|nr:hypothetical protein F5X97DRAFT_311941 [Nemania serpens]
MKWYISLLSLASLPAAFAAPTRDPSAIARNVATGEPAAAILKRDEEEVELLTWGSGRWQYGGSKREEPEVAIIKKDEEEVELLTWGSGRWQYGGSKRAEAKA